MFYAIIATVSTKDQKGIKHFSPDNGGTFITRQKTAELTKISAYDYNESMKSFSVIDMVGRVPICPICWEEVFHVDGWRAKYFSHYPKTEKSPECAYRVKYVPRDAQTEYTNSVTNSLPLLLNFQHVLDHYLNGVASGSINQKHQKLIQVLCKSMRDNWLDSRIIRSAFNFKSPEEMYNVFSTIAPFLIKLIPKLKDFESSYIFNVAQRNNAIFIWNCLHIPRERTNLEFLMQLTIQLLENHGVMLNDKDDNLKDEIIFWSFGILSIIPWHITIQQTSEV